MRGHLDRLLWAAGRPFRVILLALIRIYQVSLGAVGAGHCRFYPSCSAYAEQAIRQSGAIRGVALSAWRILRCSPLSKGGVDYPPRGRSGRGKSRRARRGRLYDAAIHRGPEDQVQALGRVAT